MDMAVPNKTLFTEKTIGQIGTEEHICQLLF